MFEISVNTHFSAAHHLKEYPGKCAVVHGHNWEVEVFIRGQKLSELGMLIDFGDVKKAVVEILDQVDHSDLNEHTAFQTGNPTSENIAKYLFEELSAKLNDVTCEVHRVSVKETPGSTASYWKD